jgi:predicted TIM-barrel fold metal-dependent hydrolase
MITDSLAFLGDSIFGRSVTPDALFGRLDEAGIDRAVVCPAKPRRYHLKAANDAVAEAVRAHPDRLTGLARVDPLLGEDAQAELERSLTELGLSGAFLHPWEETFHVNDPLVDGVIEVARSHAVPVTVAAGYPWLSEGLQVGELAGRFPEVTFVATNGLQINMSGLGQVDAELALEDNDNLMIQTSGVYREDFIERIVRRHGPERVLFASAYPHFDPALEIRRVQWAAFSAGEQQTILHENAARLWRNKPGLPVTKVGPWV